MEIRKEKGSKLSSNIKIEFFSSFNNNNINNNNINKIQNNNNPIYILKLIFNNTNKIT